MSTVKVEQWHEEMAREYQHGTETCVWGTSPDPCAECRDLARLLADACQRQREADMRHVPVTRTVVRTAMCDLESAKRKLKNVETELTRMIDAPPPTPAERSET